MIALFLAAGLSFAALEPKADPPLVISHVAIVGLDDRGPLRDASVVIRDGRIVAVGTSGEAAVPEGAKTIDGSGKFLIPGLWDMHVHFSNQASMPLFLANGVTGVRVMWGNPSFGFPMGPYHFRWRSEIEDGKLVGPRMVVASNIFDGPKPIWPSSLGLETPEQARQAVRKAKADGADFVKVYSKLSPEVFRAIADECKTQKIDFAGHIPSSVSAREASDLGQKTFEHLYGVLADCSSRRDEILAKRAALSASGKNLSPFQKETAELDRQSRETFDEALAADLFAKLKANGTWQCPTLSVLRAIASLDDDAFRNDSRLKYVDAMTRSRWNPKNDFRLKSMTKEDFARQKTNFDRALDCVGRLHRAAVPILAGTDELNPYIFPGFSLHDELALLVRAGLSPRDALRAATINPAKFLGKEAMLGTVEVGKAADLVLLDADPMADITNTTKIRAVIVRGRLLDRDALDAMLKAAEVSK
jgi:imidazolonepropionase-like amidohydrolase